MESSESSDNSKKTTVDNSQSSSVSSTTLATIDQANQPTPVHNPQQQSTDNTRSSEILMEPLLESLQPIIQRPINISQQPTPLIGLIDDYPQQQQKSIENPQSSDCTMITEESKFENQPTSSSKSKPELIILSNSSHSSKTMSVKSSSPETKSIPSERGFNNLSKKVLNKIASHLRLKDRLNCRLVCVGWSQKLANICDEIDELVVSKDYTINNRWWNSETAFSVRDSFIEKICLKNARFSLSSLKKLKLDFGLKEQGLLHCQCFIHLDYLEILGLKLYQNDRKYETITLPSLKTLVISKVITDFQDTRLFLNLPSLRNVCFGQNSIDFIQLSNPERILNIEFDFYNMADSLTAFKNVRTIRCNKILELDRESWIGLLGNNFPKIMELHCNVSHLTSFEHQIRPNLAIELPDLFNDLVNRIRNSKRIVNVYIQGVLISRFNDRNFEQYNFYDSLFSMHSQNQDLLPSRILSIKEIDYTMFSGLEEGSSFLNSFFARYPNIQVVCLSNLKNEFNQNVMIFLGRLFKLSSLMIEYCGFDERFFERLSQLDSLIMSLTKIRYLSCDRKNVEFPFRFKFLHHLECNLFNKQMLINKVQQTKATFYFEFYFDLDLEQTIQIYKLNDNCFNIKISDNDKEYDYPRKNLDQFIDTVNGEQFEHFFLNWLDT